MKLLILKEIEKIDIEVSLISMIWNCQKKLNEENLDDEKKDFIKKQIENYNKLIKKLN